MASQDGTGGISRLAKMQMKFQQRQIEEREQRRMEMTSSKSQLDETTSLNSSFGRGKVRQMFDERRRGTGIDKSYPLKPIVATSTRSTSGGKIITTTTSKIITKKSPLNNVRLNNNTLIKTQVNDINKKSHIINNNNSSNGVVYGNNNNSIEILSNKHQDKNSFSSSGDTSIDDETFPDNNSELDNIEFCDKNVGKLTSLSLDDKTNMEINGNLNNNTKNENCEMKIVPQSKNNIKLKPVLTKKIPLNRPTHTSTTQKPLKSIVKILPTRMTSTTPDNMVACSICNRFFNNDRIGKHEEICKKTKTKQRKQFDTALHRVKGTEAESFVRRSKIVNNNIKRPGQAQSAINQTVSAVPKKPGWRKKHEEFIESIRAAKKVQQHLARGGKLSDLPPPPPSENADYVQCPHCNRRFNEAAANRHIPKCATMLHNKPKPTSKPQPISKPPIATRSNLSRPANKTSVTATPMHKR